MNRFESLCRALEGCFDLPLEELPEYLRQRVAQDFFPRSWDALTAKARREWAELWDYQHDPSKEVQRASQLALMQHRHDLEELIDFLNSHPPQNFEELERKKSRLPQLAAELDQVNQDLARARGDILDVPQGGDVDQGLPPVPASAVKLHFRVLPDTNRNIKWWERMMREASRNGLVDSRAGRGKPGPGGSLWRPDDVAMWLADRHFRRHQGMSVDAARKALKQFQGYDDRADEIFPAEADCPPTRNCRW
jgi:hypothetical protein